MQALYTQASGSNTVEDICCLKDHKSYITRKTHKARLTATQWRLYHSSFIKAIIIFISDVPSKVRWMVKPSEISQHLCVNASMNSSAGILDPFIWNCWEITDASWHKMENAVEEFTKSYKFKRLLWRFFKTVLELVLVRTYETLTSTWEQTSYIIPVNVCWCDRPLCTGLKLAVSTGSLWRHAAAFK